MLSNFACLSRSTGIPWIDASSRPGSTTDTAALIPLSHCNTRTCQEKAAQQCCSMHQGITHRSMHLCHEGTCPSVPNFGAFKSRIVASGYPAQTKWFNRSQAPPKTVGRMHLRKRQPRSPMSPHLSSLHMKLPSPCAPCQGAHERHPSSSHHHP